MILSVNGISISKYRSVRGNIQTALSTDLLCNSMDWFLYDKDLCHVRVNIKKSKGETETISKDNWDCGVKKFQIK